MTSDADAVDQLVRTVTSEVHAWHRRGEYGLLRVQEAKSVMLDHLRAARQEGPLV